MHLGQLANCFNDFNDDRAVLQVQNDCIATVTVFTGGGPLGPNTGKGCTIGFLTVLKHPKPNLSSRH